MRHHGISRVFWLILLTALTAASALLNAFLDLRLLGLACTASGLAFGGMQGIVPAITSEIFGMQVPPNASGACTRDWGLSPNACTRRCICRPRWATLAPAQDLSVGPQRATGGLTQVWLAALCDQLQPHAVWASHR